MKGCSSIKTDSIRNGTRQGKRSRNEMKNEPPITETKLLPKFQSSNGWHWVGEPYLGHVFTNMEKTMMTTKCYRAMRHEQGDVICPRDCILLKSGRRKSDLPYVAKVASIWENLYDGQMMLSLYWYYRPQQTSKKKSDVHPQEVYSSRHRDYSYVACIEDKCYVLTFNEYARFRKELRRKNQDVPPPTLVVPPLPAPSSTTNGPLSVYRPQPIPPVNISPDLVFFCRKFYDINQHRTVNNPNFVS